MTRPSTNQFCIDEASPFGHKLPASAGVAPPPLKHRA
jgi:hypothetical protein